MYLPVVILLLSVGQMVKSSASSPQDTALEDNMLDVHSTVQSDRRNTRNVPLIIFPGESGYPAEPVVEEEEEDVVLPEWMDVDLDELSMDKISLLDNANNIQDLATLFGLTKEQQDRLDKESQRKREEELGVIGLRFATTVKATEAEFAVCKPELEKVELEAPPNTTYLPQCTRLLRCGGCCSGKHTSCQPTSTEIVTLKVMAIQKKTEKPGGRRRRRSTASFAFVDQVNHLNCSCLCRIQKNHCDSLKQNYNPSECACVCKSREEEEQCVMKSTHDWDRTTCSCKCKRIHECSTGEEFDLDECRCVRSIKDSSNAVGLVSKIPDSTSYSTKDSLPAEMSIQPPEHIQLPDSLDELSDEELNILNNITSMTDFISTFGLVVQSTALTSNSSTNSQGYVEVDGEWAACEVKQETVNLEGPKNVAMVWPTSLRLNRCSGACAVTSQSCTPTKMQTIKIKVLGINPRKENKTRTARYYTLQQDEHVSCGCLRPS